jgi:tetratricopeptide (TPR) repeat protein
MKTRNIIFVVTALIAIVQSASVFAFDDKYTEAMQKNIQAVYTAKAIPEYQTAVNALERIGAAEKTKWEPFYYASFGYIMMSNQEKDNAKKDTYLDQAVTALNKAKAIVPNESEIIAMEGFIYMMRISADPAARGPQYTPMAMQAFNKAVAVNPENPRALALLAQMQFGTAQFFGSSTAEACATNTSALEKFESFQSENVLAPRWGQQMAEGMKSKCGK